jgi:hypothetical protein
MSLHFETRTPIRRPVPVPGDALPLADGWLPELADPWAWPAEPECAECFDSGVIYHTDGEDELCPKCCGEER